MKEGKSMWAGFGAAFLSVLGSITCCGAPIAAGILASVGIGASQLAFLKSIQPYLMGVAVLALAFGFYRVYFKKNNSCCDTGAPKDNRKTKSFLWVITASMLVMFGFSIHMNSESNEASEVQVGTSLIEENKNSSCCGTPKKQAETSCCETPKKKESSCCGTTKVKKENTGCVSCD